jgi:hypothetical protein
MKFQVLDILPNIENPVTGRPYQPRKPQRHGRRTTPARSEPVHARAHRARAPADPQDRNRHEDQKQAPARTVTRHKPDSLRLILLTRENTLV